MTLVLYPTENSTIYIPFATYAGATGASVTMTGLAVTDIEIYKNGSVTQRSSDAGYALLDTDGIDFDGLTGIHGFSIDLSNNTDSGFYAVDSWYWVVVSSITVDSQTVNFIPAVFQIKSATRGMAGTALPAAAADAAGGLPISDAGGLDLDAQIGIDIDNIFTTVSALGVLLGINAISSSLVGGTGNDTTHVNLPGVTHGNDEINDHLLVIFDASEDEYHARWIEDWVLGTELATVATLPFTPTDITNDAYWVMATRRDVTGGSGLDAAGVRAAIGMSSANLDTQLSTIDNFVDDIESRLGTPSDLGGGATVAANLVAIEGQTDDIPSLSAILQGLVLLTGDIGSTGNDTTHIHLPGLTYGDDEINSHLLVIYDDSASEYHSRWITDWVLSTELATVATLPFTPQNATDTYWLLSARADVTGGAGLDADETRAALGLASANLDDQLAALPTGTENADAVLSRGVVNVEDTANATSLAALVLAALESEVVTTNWEIRKTTGATFTNKTVTLDGDGHITGVT